MQEQKNADSNEKQSIGVVWMESDRDVIVRVRLEDESGCVGDMNLHFAPDHPNYSKVLEYVGGLQPDEAKKLYDWDATLN
jgi:hypothetical protein